MTSSVMRCTELIHLQEQVESLGPVVGPLIFILTTAAAEMIPLFPTQPLSLASGLLFGPVQVRRHVSTTLVVHSTASEVTPFDHQQRPLSGLCSS